MSEALQNPAPAGQATDWESKFLGGDKALAVSWRREADRDTAVRWRLSMNAETFPVLVGEGVVDATHPLDRINLTRVYADPNISHGEIGLRVSPEMALWCDIPLGRSSWYNNTLQTWSTPEPDPHPPHPPPPDPFDPSGDDLRHRSLAWGAAIEPPPPAEILDFLWFEPAIPLEADGRFVAFADGGGDPSTLPISVALTAARQGSTDPVVVLAAMQAAAAPYVAPLTADQQALASKVVAFLEYAAALEGPTPLIKLDEAAVGILDMTPAAFVTDQVASPSGLFPVVWQQLYADALIPTSGAPAGAPPCAVLAMIARGMSLIIALNDCDHDLALAVVRQRLTQALLLLPPVIRPPSPDGWATVACLGVGTQKVVDQRQETYRLGEIAKVLNLMPGERLTLIDRNRTRALQTERDDNRETRAETVEDHQDGRSDLAQDMRDALAQTEVIRNYSGLKFNEVPWPELAVSGSWWGEDGAQSRTLGQAASFVQALSRRAASRLASRVARLRSTAVLREHEAVETRRIDNQAAKAPLVGSYHWLDKVCQLQMRTVGRRLVLEFLLADPAAGLVRTVEALPHHEPPLPPETWSISQDPAAYATVTADNYASAAAAYGLELPPPPAATVTVRARVSSQGPIGELEIPPGYAASAVTVAYVVSNQSLPFVAAVGTSPVTFSASSTSAITSSTSPPTEATLRLGARIAGALTDDPTPPPPPAIQDPLTYVWTSPQPGSGTGSVSFSGGLTGHTPVVCRYDGAAFSAVVEAQCAATAGTAQLSAWQVASHQAILNAYDTARARHARQIRDTLMARSSEGVGRTISRALTLDALTAMGASAPRATPTLTAQESRLLTDAMDWAEAAYAFYPWGVDATREPSPVGWLGQATGDRNSVAWLEAFLEAGSTRMLVTVRRGFEVPTLFFMAFGYFPPEPKSVFVTDLAARWLLDLDVPFPDEPELSWSLQTPTDLLALVTDERFAPGGGA